MRDFVFYTLYKIVRRIVIAHVHFSNIFFVISFPFRAF